MFALLLLLHSDESQIRQVELKGSKLARRSFFPVMSPDNKVAFSIGSASIENFSVKKIFTDAYYK